MKAYISAFKKFFSSFLLKERGIKIERLINSLRMPVYEYQCKKCRRKISVLARSIYSPIQPVCPLCGSETFRLFSTFITRRTFQGDYEDILSDSRLVKGLENNDPQALAEWGRKMSRSMEDDRMGPEWEEMMSNLEKGRGPEELEGDEGGEDMAEEE